MRPNTSLVLLVIILLYVSSANGGQVVSDKYVVRGSNLKIKTSHYIRNVRPCYSMVTCVAICNQVEGCVSVSFKSKTDRCFLGRQEIVTDAGANSTLYHFEDFISILKAVYTVYQIESPLGPNQATYTDAIQLCAERNTVVASPTDLLVSRSRGYHLCACGWLSDQTNGFVLQNESLSCGLGSFQTSIIYCNKTIANVYCYL